MFSLTYILLSSIYVGSAFAAPAEDLNDRILNGTEAPKYAYPFMVFLQYPSEDPHRDSGDVLCGGSIISEKVIVTAAHCVADSILNSLNISVNVGTIHNTFKKEGQTYAIDKVVRHPDYEDFIEISDDEFVRSPNDIAILILAESLIFTNAIQPISLPAKDHNAEKIDGGKGRVLGWGLTTYPGNTSDTLLYVDMFAAPRRNCTIVFKDPFDPSTYAYVLSEDQLCLERDKNTDGISCRGDSGGPFIQTVGNETLLVGIVSYGFADCNFGRDVHAYVPKLLDFIKQYL